MPHAGICEVFPSWRRREISRSRDKFCPDRKMQPKTVMAGVILVTICTMSTQQSLVQ
jgi:hypothetical protein